MAIKTRVRATCPTLMCDAEVQHQRHRTRRIREVGSQLNVSTSLTPAPSHLLSFNLVGCAKQVSKLINRPIMRLFGTRVGGASTNMVTEHQVGTFYNHKGGRLASGYLCTDRYRKKGLPETSGPGLVSTMRPDYPKKDRSGKPSRQKPASQRVCLR